MNPISATRPESQQNPFSGNILPIPESAFYQIIVFANRIICEFCIKKEDTSCRRVGNGNGCMGARATKSISGQPQASDRA